MDTNPHGSLLAHRSFTLAVVLLGSACTVSGEPHSCVAFDDAFPVVRTIQLQTPPAGPIGTIASLARTPERGFALADPIHVSVFLFDSSGGFLRAIGRPGDGPGEFRRPMSVYSTGDTIVVLDERHRLITVFDDHGHVLDVVRPAVTAPRGLQGGRQLVLAGTVRDSNSNGFRAGLHVLDLAGDVIWIAPGIPSGNHLYEPNFRLPLTARRSDVVALAVRSSNRVLLVNLASRRSHEVTVAAPWYRPPEWPRTAFVDDDGTRRQLTSWANSQTWLLGLHLIDADRVLVRIRDGQLDSLPYYVITDATTGRDWRSCSTAAVVTGVIDDTLLASYTIGMHTAAIDLRSIESWAP